MNASCRLQVRLLVAIIALTLSPALYGQVFSLDDNPSFPLTTAVPVPGATPFPPFGFGAEDPFGTVFGPPGLAPSPSLFSPPAGIYLDGTILATGAVFPGLPELHLAAPFDFFTGFPHNFIDALSNNSAPSPGAPVNLLFSVDRVSAGVPGSDSAIEAGFNQQPSDIYVSSSMFADPGSFVGSLPPAAGFVPGPLNPPAPGTNRLLFNQAAFDLTAGLPPAAIPPFAPAPPIGFGTHDNVDAFELRPLDTTGDGLADVEYFFSINPDDAVNKKWATFGAVPFDSADIRIAPVGAGGASFLFAPPAALGLAPIIPVLPVPPIIGNDIDGLILFDNAPVGALTPGVDFALFSLSPGSIDLATFGTSGADIFFTDFTGSYGLYASAADLGLLPTDNVDALEMLISADADLSGTVNFADLALVAINYNTIQAINGWRLGDFDGNGIVGLSDLVVFAGGLGAMTGAGSESELGPAVPEPSGILVAALAAFGGLFCRWRHKARSFRTPALLSCFAAALVLLASSTAATRAATPFVTTRSIGGGLFQHRLSVFANDGDVRGFEIFVTAAGTINQIRPFGMETAFADDAAALFPVIGANPARDTHVLYNRTDGFNLSVVDTVGTFSVATGVAPATPLVANGTTRDLFQLVTAGNIALTATRLRINVGGGGGDQFFDGRMLQGQLGDYSRNGTADAADYVVWRSQRGQIAIALAADGDGDGDVDDDDYNLWRANFGRSAPGAGSGSTQFLSSSAAVPEPSGKALVGLLVACVGMARIKRGVEPVRTARYIGVRH